MQLKKTYLFSLEGSLVVHLNLENHARKSYGA